MKPSVDETIQRLLSAKLLELENYLSADVFNYYGPIFEGSENFVLKLVEDLAYDEQKRDKLFIILTTNGGSAFTVERYVNIVRKHYKEVNFLVPDYAYSAGTIFCMSGDDIYMDYYSVLGPIDPMIQNKDGKWVPALGYLDKVNEMLGKAENNKLTQAEFLILKDIDLAELREYEQARDLTTDLLKKGLVKYKFKNWTVHASNPDLKGKAVTNEQKEGRAIDIANKLSNNEIWKSHGRPINIEILEKELKLKIIDYSAENSLREIIRSYYELLNDYVHKNNFPTFIHTRKFI
jgi:hypothetical protein